MTNPKPGKECPNYFCTKGKETGPIPSEVIGCRTCLGLGWIPAPGDELTWHEAEVLDAEDRCVMASKDGEKWVFVNPAFSEAWNFKIPGWQYCLAPAWHYHIAPAAKEEKAEKRESVALAASRLLTGSIEAQMKLTPFQSFERGVDWVLSLPTSEIEAMKKERAYEQLRTLL